MPDHRELLRHPELKNNNNDVIRPAIEPFQYQVWLRAGDIVAKVPFQSWEDRGNDEHLLHAKCSSLASFKTYMDGHDAHQKSLI